LSTVRLGTTWVRTAAVCANPPMIDRR